MPGPARGKPKIGGLKGRRKGPPVLVQQKTPNDPQLINFTPLGKSAVPDFDATIDATSFATSSWTPPPSGLIYLWVSNYTGFVGENIPTVTGNNLGWIQIITVEESTFNRLTLFAADAAGSQTGVTTIDFAGQTQDFFAAMFGGATGVDLTNGVTAAFVQSASNTGTGTTGTVTMANAASDSNNRVISGWHHFSAEVFNTQVNWTAEDAFSGHATFYRTDVFENPATTTWASSVAWQGIAVELKAWLHLVPVPQFVPNKLKLGGLKARRGGPPVLRSQTQYVGDNIFLDSSNAPVFTGHWLHLGPGIGRKRQGPPILKRQRFDEITQQAVTTTITVDVPGAITWTGSDIGLTTNAVVASGGIIWSGATDIVLIGLTTTISVDTPGAITWTGSVIGLTTNIVPTPGAITWTGSDVGLTTKAVVTAGAITWTGSAIGLTTTFVVVPGAITWTGSALALVTKMVPTSGAITWAGGTVSLTTALVITPGAVAWTGSVIGLTTKIGVASGAIIWAGATDIVLILPSGGSGFFLFSPVGI